ncbi:collagen repeat protein [Moumouvirus australiensis]|uniref:Collagen repeat protein n=1 Tax=Moumouvirus australiensis TaxID=2109587 RepID=A0A2P1EKV7_9VIRU|nr:collagen repeat protein [Moumouvirus australiensis]AVL94510.1 collagen repeat protein [Moumouvirus australiensis]
MYNTRPNVLRSNRRRNIDATKGNTDNNNFYFVGPQGLKGEAGSRIFTESGSPPPNLGRNGDVYIDNTSGGLYNKINNFWILQSSVLGNDGDKGDKGERGSNILTGTGLPRNIIGNNGDIYIDNSTGAVYRKINNVWVFQFNTIGTNGDKGDKGDKGDPNGPQGDKGEKGDKGNTGSQIITGPGIPDPGLGNNGDIYIDTSTGDLYVKINNTWVLQSNIDGDKGDKGDIGSQIITGNQPPTDNIGNDGDIYIDNSTGDLYIKVDNVWVLQSNIDGDKGDKGDIGSQIITGTGVPSPTLGNNGDIYIDNSTNDIYQKIGDTWVLQSNLTGTKGDKGDKGDIGSQIFTGVGIPSPVLGVDGDIYLDDLTGDLYRKIGGVWVLQTNLTGPQGDKGDKGDKGDIGSQIFTGAGIPAPALGVDGDVYLDDLTGDLYQKLGGVWILQTNLTGTKGDKGDIGSQIITGAGVPAPALGVDGDVYLNNLTGDLYRKIAGIWVLQTNLTGPQGDKGDKGDKGDIGSQIFTGAGIPAPALGVDGDVYLDDLTGDLYQKLGGVWVLQTNLTGDKGDKGDIGSQIITGAGVPAPALGVDGDVYLNNLTGDLYRKIAGIWVLQTNLTGPQGDKGDKGDIGSQIITGAGVPAPALGVDGDVYLNNLTGDLYSKIAGIWVLQTNLTGPQGDKGDKGDLGTPGTPGLGAIIPYSSGLTPVALATVLGGGISTTGAIYDFGVSVPTVDLVGLNIDFTGILGGVLPNTAWSVPRDATITSIATAFQNTANVDLTIGGSVFIRTQLYRETLALPGVFVPIPGAIVEVALPSALITIGFVVRGITTGLNIPVAAGDRLILFANTRSTAIITVSAIVGYLSSGISLS